MCRSVAERVAAERKTRVLETGNCFAKDGKDDQAHQSTRFDACIYFGDQRTLVADAMIGMFACVL